MRRFFLLVFTGISALTFPQSDISNQELKDQISQIEGDLNKAKVRVDNLCANSQTSKNASSWYLKGYVYTEFAKSEVFSTKYQGSDEMAVEAIKKAMELDTKHQFYSDILNITTDLTITEYNKAIKNYNDAVNTKSNDKFLQSIHYFEIYFDCYQALGIDNKFIDDFIKYNKVDLKAINFYYAYATQTVGMTEKATTMYGKIIDLNDDFATARTKGMPLAYLYYSDMLEKAGEVEKAVAVIKRGINLFPQEKELIINATSIFNKNKRIDDLVELVEKQNIDKISDLKLLFILGQNYGRLAKEYQKNGYNSTADTYLQKALNIYKKAMTISTKNNNDMFSVYYNMSVIYFNNGVNLYKTNYENRVSFQEQFNQALEYLEKAHALKKNDKKVMNMMMKAYQMTDQSEKAKQIESELYGN